LFFFKWAKFLKKPGVFLRCFFTATLCYTVYKLFTCNAWSTHCKKYVSAKYAHILFWKRHSHSKYARWTREIKVSYLLQTSWSISIRGTVAQHKSTKMVSRSAVQSSVCTQSTLIWAKQVHSTPTISSFTYHYTGIQ